MHTAHNVAYENIDTELNICIDSDDCLAEDAIDKILTFWDSHEHIWRYHTLFRYTIRFDNWQSRSLCFYKCYW